VVWVLVIMQARLGEHMTALQNAFEKDTPEAASASKFGVIPSRVHMGLRIWSTIIKRTLGLGSAPRAILLPTAAPAAAMADPLIKSRLFISNPLSAKDTTFYLNS
jgi:hypothetical protein